MPSPGEPQAEPTIGKAINGGYDLLEAKCNRRDRVSLVPLRFLKHPAETPVWKLEAALYCEPCREGRHYTGWVCEDHPDQPWEGPHACACGGAGAPCPHCNAATADEPPRLPKGFKPDGE
jgi:hypothetical protein